MLFIFKDWHNNTDIYYLFIYLLKNVYFYQDT